MLPAGKLRVAVEAQDELADLVVTLDLSRTFGCGFVDDGVGRKQVDVRLCVPAVQGPRVPGVQVMDQHLILDSWPVHASILGCGAAETQLSAVSSWRPRANGPDCS